MMYDNALRRFWPQQMESLRSALLGVKPQEQPMPFGGNYMPSGPYKGPLGGQFQSGGGMPGMGMGGMEGPFSGPFNVPNMGVNVPNMGAPNALMGYGGGLRSSGFGFQEPRKYGVRQRY